MNEASTKRRIWIRNIIIIFLTVLLLLTLFSHTILNRSLPEVAVRYPQYGTIATRVRSTASVTANQSYSVTLSQTRVVSAVNVRVGQSIGKGDVLLTLEPGDSSELEALRREEESLNLQLIAKLQSAPKTDDGAASGDGTVKSLRAQLENQRDALENARLNLSDAEYTLGELREDLSALRGELDAIRARQGRVPSFDEVQNAKRIAAQAEQNIDALNAEKARLEAKRGATGQSHYYTAAELEALVAEAEYKLGAAKDAYNAAFTEYERALRAVESLTAEKKRAEAEYARAQAAVTDYRSAMPQSVTYQDVLTAQQAVANAQKAVDDAQKYYTRAEYTDAKTAYDAAKRAYDAAYGKADAARLAELKTALDAAEAQLQAIEPKEIAYQNAVQAYQQAQQDYWTKYMQFSQSASASGQLSQLETDQTNAKAYLDAVTAQLEAAQIAQDKALEANNKARENAEDAEDALEALKKNETYDDLSAEINVLAEQIKAAEKQKEDAGKVLSDASDDAVSALAKEYAAKEKEITAKERAVTAQERTVASARRAVTSAQSEIASLETQISAALADAEKNAESAGAAARLEEKKYQIELAQIRDELNKKRTEIARAEDKQLSDTVISPVSGVIESIGVTVGSKAEANTPLLTVTLSDMGYTMSCTVTAEQAANIRVGETANIQWYYYGNAPTARVTSIKSDPSSQGRSRIVTLEVTGEVNPGTSLTFSLGEKNASYDTVVPNSAVREDSSGKFVLVVSARSTPLGNRYTARRVDVTVLASDETNSAVSGAVSGEYVITNSTTPISNGMQVRLSDNTN